jgi:lysophospholipase L1-like esterase
VFLRYASLAQIQHRGLPNKFTPHRYLGYYPTPGYAAGANRHNALGYRGDEIDVPKPKGRFRIVCLGGSTTYNGSVDDYTKSYPEQLERYLRGNGFNNAEVVNAGASNWSSWESLVNLQFRVLDLEPDLLLVYHGINDIHQRFVWPHDAYRGDNSGTRSAVPELFATGVLEHSTLLRMLMIEWGWVRPHASLERTTASASSTNYAAQFNEQKARGIYPEAIFENMPAAKMLRTNPPIYFERNLRNLVAVADASGIDVVLMSFATSPKFVEQPRVSSEEYIAAYRETNRIVEQIAGDTPARFFDFASVFPDDVRYYTDGRHVTEAGAALKARLVGNYLLQQGFAAVE